MNTLEYTHTCLPIPTIQRKRHVDSELAALPCCVGSEKIASPALPGIGGGGGSLPTKISGGYSENLDNSLRLLR